MATLIEAELSPDTADLRHDPARSRRAARLTVLDVGPRRPAPPTLRTALTRARGGTFSPTVDVIHFVDGGSAHTDLIRLNPDVDAYSLDFDGISPRQLCHYRELARDQATADFPGAVLERVALVLAAGYPAVSTMELTRRLRTAGYRLGPGTIPEHQAIAATQAAIWRLTNGLELDTRPLDLPTRAKARIEGASTVRTVRPRRDGSLNWSSQLPAGRTCYLELSLTGRSELQAFSFRVGPRTGRHACHVRLEASADGVGWRQVSHSGVRLDDPWHPHPSPLRRRLGAAATLSTAGPAGRAGYRHYRLAVRGPECRDGLLELHDVRLELLGAARFRNAARVVALYELLLAAANGRERYRPTRVLIGSRTPTGPAVFTPLAMITGPDALRPVRRTSTIDPRNEQEPSP